MFNIHAAPLGESNHLNLSSSNTSNLFTRTKAIVFIVILVAGGVGFYFISQQEKSADNESASEKFHRHTVVSNGPECAPIGM